jgi:hypothetical protein
VASTQRQRGASACSTEAGEVDQVAMTKPRAEQDRSTASMNQPTLNEMTYTLYAELAWFERWNADRWYRFCLRTNNLDAWHIGEPLLAAVKRGYLLVSARQQQAGGVRRDQLNQTDTTPGRAGDPRGPAVERPTQTGDSFDAAVHSHGHRQAERLHSFGYRHEACSIRRFLAQLAGEPVECHSSLTPTITGHEPIPR